MVSIISSQQPIYQCNQSFWRRCPIIKGLVAKKCFSTDQTQAKAIKKRSVEHIIQIANWSVEELNAKWEDQLKVVENDLISIGIDQVGHETKEAISVILKSLTLPNLEKFIDHLVELSASHDGLISNVVVDAFPLESMLKAIQAEYPDKFTTIDHYVKQVARCLPPERPQTPTQEHVINSSRKKNIVSRFFPNLAQVFMRAFDLSDTLRPPDKLYEYGILVTLYINFFKLPYFLVKGLSQLVPSPVAVLLVSAIVIGISVGALYVYLRWLKPCPTQVDYCHNWTEKFGRTKVEHALCRDDKLEEAAKYLGAGRCVVFVGEPGVGKTQMMHALVSKVDRLAMAFDNCKLFGGGGFELSTAEKMSAAFVQARGYENRMFFICDELGDALKSKFSDIVSVFKTMKDEYPNIALVTAITKDQWEKLRAEDKALEERFKPIFVEPSTQEETLRILGERSHQGVSVYYHGLKKLVMENNKITTHAEPRQSINVYEELLVRISKLTPKEVSTEKLHNAQVALAILKSRMELMDDPSRDPFSKECEKYLIEVDAAEKALQEAEKEVESQRDLIKKIQRFQRLDRQLLQQKNEALRVLSSTQTYSEQEKQAWQVRLLFTNFFALKRVEKTINALVSTLSSLNKNISLRVDAKAILGLFQN